MQAIEGRAWQQAARAGNKKYIASLVPVIAAIDLVVDSEGSSVAPKKSVDSDGRWCGCVHAVHWRLNL